MRNYKLFAALAVVLLVAACAESNPLMDSVSNPPAFFTGLWHGFIAWIAVIMKIFDSSTAVYAVVNTGAWYDIGFLLGVSLWIGFSIALFGRIW